MHDESSDPGYNPYLPSGDLNLNPPNPDSSSPARRIGELARWQSVFAALLAVGMLLTLSIFAFAAIGEDPAGAIGGLACGGGIGLLMYGLPAVMLWKAAGSARRYARHPDATGLAEFTSGQLNFWRTIGILALVLTILYGLAMVLMFVGFAGVAG